MSLLRSFSKQTKLDFYPIQEDLKQLRCNSGKLIVVFIEFLTQTAIWTPITHKHLPFFTTQSKHGEEALAWIGILLFPASEHHPQFLYMPLAIHPSCENDSTHCP